MTDFFDDNPFADKEGAADSTQPEMIKDPIDGTFIISTSHDNFKAMLTVTPPLYKGKPVSLEEVKAKMADLKISHGIDEKVLKDTVDECNKNERKLTNVVFAQGTPPTAGKNGYVQYKFEFPKDISPPKQQQVEKEEQDGDEDEALKGTVDYKELNLIVNVKVDDVIAEKIPPEDGQEGVGVTGESIKPPMAKSTEMLPGQNVTLSDDGMSFIAKIDGHVVIKGKYINVEPIFIVPHDVDYSTGNVRFKGTVVVKGTVLEGFAVEAGQDINIKKLSEGASLTAGGNITVEGGIIGNEKCKITAGGKIKTTYIENALIEAHDDIIVTKLILNSNATTNGRILIEKGSIVGGSVNAAMGVYAKVIGSDYAGTKVIAGNDIDIQKRLRAITGEIGNAEKNIEKITATLGPFVENPALIARYSQEKQQLIKKLIAQLTSQKQAIKDLQEEKESLYKEQSRLKTAVVAAYGDLKPGVKVMIGGCSFENQRLVKGVQLWENREKKVIEMGGARKKV